MSVTARMESKPEQRRRTEDTVIDFSIFADHREATVLRTSSWNHSFTGEKNWRLRSTVDRINKAVASLPPTGGLCRSLVSEAVWCWDGALSSIAELDNLPSAFATELICAELVYVVLRRPKMARVHKSEVFVAVLLLANRYTPVSLL